MSDQPQPPPPPPGDEAADSADKKPWWKRPWGIGILVLLGLFVVVGITSDPDEDEADPIAADNDEEAEDEQPDEADEPEPDPETEPEREPEPEPEPDPEPEFAFTDEIELAGTGDDILEIEILDNEPAVVHFTHDGSSNFQVTGYSAAGDRSGGLVNEIGNYDGIRPINFQDPPVADFEIAADGNWTATIRPLHEAREADTVSEGTGDAVLLVSHIDASNVHATHDGDSNFQVTAWGERRSGMVNEIGAYEGRVRLPSGTLALEIVADGNWTFDFS
jgi:hypothetical protein